MTEVTIAGIIVVIVTIVIVTVVIVTVVTVAAVTVVIVTSYSKNNLTSQQPMRCYRWSFLQFLFI